MNLDILKIASDTNNNKSIKNYTHHSKLKNSMCGDEMQIDLVIKKRIFLTPKKIKINLQKNIDETY